MDFGRRRQRCFRLCQCSTGDQHLLVGVEQQLFQLAVLRKLADDLEERGVCEQR